MLASTLKLRPRYFLIVLALAGDSTITRFVFPLVPVLRSLPFLLLVEVDDEDEARVPVLVAPVVAFAVVAFPVLVVLLVVFPVVFPFVVAIFLFSILRAKLTS